MTAYRYVGDRELTFPAYADVRTDRTLVVTPGKTYEIRATDAALPVPPDAISWVEATEADVVEDKPEPKKTTRRAAVSGDEAEKR